ncbi:MAG: beta-ketoacyl-ACP synthase II [Proteobacteria bacterium]|nr:beta-ketoacyl-ACP synthase II [Pseudomonadota bacterium]
MDVRLTSRTLELRRVVVTGMGTLNPLGNDVGTSWNGALKGESGIRPVERFEVDDMPVRFAGQVVGFDPSDVFEKKEVRRLDRFLHLAMGAAVQAVEDSGLDLSRVPSERVGVMVGSGIAGLQALYDNCTALADRGPSKVSPFFVPTAIANMASGLISMRYGVRGPNSCVVTACTTGTHNLGDAYRLIQRGDADAMIAGGSEAPVNRTGLAAFASMKALSRRNDDWARASRPFDKDRDGFVLAEGAGVLMLESLEHALGRGARIGAEIIGYGMSGDAHHMTAPPKDGMGAQLAMRKAVEDAGIAFEDVDYINAHGTSTAYNDRIETHAIKQVFGEHAYELKVSSTKSMTGHLLGGAGGVEAVFTTLALREGRLPPTINHFEPDPECDLDYVANQAQDRPARIALSNSFGFGGTNGCLALARYEPE